MPYSIVQQNDEWCVVKDDNGETIKCHPTQADAEAHITALNINVQESAPPRIPLREKSTNPLVILERSKDNKRRVKAAALTTGVINRNGRRYPAGVVRDAIIELQQRMERGGVDGEVFGESGHPWNPNILETIIKWERVRYQPGEVPIELENGTTEYGDGQVIAEGFIIPTSRGRDLEAVLDAGVAVGVSIRAWGDAETIKIGEQDVEEVTELYLEAFDLVVNPSDRVAAILESRDKERQTEIKQEEPTMAEVPNLTLEQLRQMYPGAVKKIEEERDAERKAELEAELQRRAAREEEERKLIAEHTRELRKQLGLTETDDLQAKLAEQRSQLEELREEKKRREIEEYIVQETEALKKHYPDFLFDQMVESIRSFKPDSIDAARDIVKAKKQEYEPIAARLRIAAQRGSISVLGSVLEHEAGVPDYAIASHRLTETLQRRGMIKRRDMRKPRNKNEQIAADMLQRFDELHRDKLFNEAQLIETAETGVGNALVVPYSVMRAVIPEAWAALVSTSVFDIGTTNVTPFRIYYEEYTAETGHTVTVTGESVNFAAVDTWYDLDYKRVIPGTVTISGQTELDTFLVDYEYGKILAQTGSGISGATSVSYQAYDFRPGENAEINQAHVSLDYVTLEAEFDRLAMELTDEMIKYSASQVGWDAVSNTASNLISQLSVKIDQDLLYRGLTAALQVSSNSGGTWTASTDTLDNLVEKIGAAKVKLVDRNYMAPVNVICSHANADLLGNWAREQERSVPDTDMVNSGFATRIKGVDVYGSSQFSDGFILICHPQLVMHRVYSPMEIKGPYPVYGTNQKIKANELWYCQIGSGTAVPLKDKGSYVVIA